MRVCVLVYVGSHQGIIAVYRRLEAVDAHNADRLVSVVRTTYSDLVLVVHKLAGHTPVNIFRGKGILFVRAVLFAGNGSKANYQ